MTIPTIVILAGGKGTRLMPLTADRPKALVEIKGRAFLSYQLAQLARQGFRRVVILAGHRGEQIGEFVAAQPVKGLDIEIVLDGPVLLGTGGCIVRALDRLTDTFGLVYGDSYLPIDFARICAGFDPERFDGLMTLFNNGNELDRSNADLDGDCALYNKASPDPSWSYIDFGFSIFQKRSFAQWPSEVFDLAELQTHLSDQRRLQGCEVFERFYEIGSFSGLREFESFVETQPDKIYGEYHEHF